MPGAISGSRRFSCPCKRILRVGVLRSLIRIPRLARHIRVWNTGGRDSYRCEALVVLKVRFSKLYIQKEELTVLRRRHLKGRAVRQNPCGSDSQRTVD